jgi:hypothetical protein
MNSRLEQPEKIRRSAQLGIRTISNDLLVVQVVAQQSLSQQAWHTRRLVLTLEDQFEFQQRRVEWSD